MSNDSEATTRIDRIEKGLRQTQDNVLLIHSDLKQIGSAVTDMAKGIRQLTDIQSDIRVLDERHSTKTKQLEDVDKTLHIRIDDLQKTLAHTTEEAHNGEKAYELITFVAKALGTLVIATAFGAFVFVLQLKGVDSG